MKFKGTIIITDPCYIVKKCTKKNPYPFPWTTENIKAPNIEEMVKKYNEWEDAHDDWTKCMYGRNMEALGIEYYFTESTLYGDWGCTTYKIKESTLSFMSSILIIKVLDIFSFSSPISNWHSLKCSSIF